MNGPRNYHIKQSKAGRERQIQYDITYPWNLKHNKNERIYETERLTDIENRLLFARRRRRRMDWEFGVSRGKLFYIE